MVHGDRKRLRSRARLQAIEGGRAPAQDCRTTLRRNPRWGCTLRGNRYSYRTWENAAD